MDFSFLRNWLGITNTSTSDVSSIPGNDNEVEEYNDEFEILEDYEFINPRDPSEVHSLPDQTGESVVEIAGFNKEKLLEMSNFCKISYGNNDEELGKKNFRALAYDDSLSSLCEQNFREAI
ncbi:hypothetical protein GO685_03705 [Wolbachia endosymbiont of Madathamugadia hiepei]|uniref:hypothetical protein n=1 Tax=Wolbachia endosymbiont of Madathamugadia hiepei TaxID=1241303 RepID=UPI00158C64B5|nr:hypothetical protein [Wolbachia endosymbiont of Madathamugadia hiepei]NUX01585.1 hypothetical protein [Wolbachia endosymbiont of Madathamugadia hiepei]